MDWLGLAVWWFGGLVVWLGLVVWRCGGLAIWLFVCFVEWLIALAFVGSAVVPVVSVRCNDNVAADESVCNCCY